MPVSLVRQQGVPSARPLGYRHRVGVLPAQRKAHLFRLGQARPLTTGMGTRVVDLKDPRVKTYYQAIQQKVNFYESHQLTHKNLDRLITDLLFLSAVIDYAGCDLKQVKRIRLNTVDDVLEDVQFLTMGLSNCLDLQQLSAALMALPDDQRVKLVIEDSQYKLPGEGQMIWKQIQDLCFGFQPFSPDSKGRYVVPSFSVLMTAFQMVFKDQLVHPRAVIGPSTLTQIDQAQRVDERDLTLAVPYKDNELYGMIRAHNLSLGCFATSWHDFIHVIMRSMLPKKIRRINNFVIDRLDVLSGKVGQTYRVVWPNIIKGVTVFEGQITYDDVDRLQIYRDRLIDETHQYYIECFQKGITPSAAVALQKAFKKLAESYDHRKFQSIFLHDILTNQDLWKQALGMPLSDLEWVCNSDFYRASQGKRPVFQELLKLNSNQKD